MGVSFASYEIARSGLFVNERALYVTGHNISNVNTPGYVRQQAMITTGPFFNTVNKNGLYQLGLGADIQQVRQIRHMFLDNIYRRENTNLGYWEARAKTLSELEALLGEPMEEGLQDVMNQFWDSWQELSKEPDSLTVRALVRQRGEAFVHHVNRMARQIEKLQDDINSEIAVRIDEVNELTREISGLNFEILKSEVTGDAANDYRDRRNVLADRLVKLLDCQVYEASDGRLEITAGGYYLVSRNEHTELEARKKTAADSFYVPGIKGTDIEVKLTSGTIKGLLESRGEVFGARGSFENGTPNTRADIVIAVDVSDTSGSYLSQVRSNIERYVDEIDKSGLDYNLRLITYGDSVMSSADYGTDGAALAAAIPAVPSADTGNNFGGAGGVLEELEGLTFRDDANKYALVFTGESADGDGGAPADVNAYAGRLNSIGMNTAVVTDTAFYSSGNPGGEPGWDVITGETGGRLYDIDTPPAEYASVMTSIGVETNGNINMKMSVVQPSLNIISHIKKRLNALINILVREVNHLHRSGYTLGNPPSGGQDFFQAVNTEYPLEMGNLKLNDNLTNLSNIAASASGASGDNTVALDISNLRSEHVLTDITGQVGTDDYYRSIILETGFSASDAERISSNQKGLVFAADQQRKSIAGVSMDEEMANMMKYKFAYNAASRAINVIDKMMETMIERTGLTGR